MERVINMSREVCSWMDHACCFKKSSKLHSWGEGCGSRSYTRGTVLFSSNYRRASMCYLWATSAATLTASICCI